MKQSYFARKNQKVTKVQGSLLHKILEALPPHLSQARAEQPLEQIYDVGIHQPTGSLFVCNKGAILHTKTPLTQKDYLTYHVGFGIYLPEHGLELINVGISGDLENSETVIVRPESACTPSFIFGSQRCNCYDQWVLARELAGHYNQVKMPNIKGQELEEHIKASSPRNRSQAVILIHMDSQNGMGSGSIEGEYNPNLTATAFLRHRGEYTAEQAFSTSVAGGFTSIGIQPDPRKLNDGVGYKVPAIILDYFGICKPVITLTNNKDKIKALQNSGYDVKPVQCFARADNSCYLETEDRRKEFGHDIPKGIETTIEKELKRIKHQIDKINSQVRK